MTKVLARAAALPPAQTTAGGSICFVHRGTRYLASVQRGQGIDTGWHPSLAPPWRRL